MIRKLFKILLIASVGIFATGLVIAALVAIFVPEEELNRYADTPPEPTATVPEPMTDPPEAVKPDPPPVEYKAVDWTKSPAGQGLKVGDWIEAHGRPLGLIDASHIKTDNADVRPFGDGGRRIEMRPNGVTHYFELSYYGSGVGSVRIEPTSASPVSKISSVRCFSFPNPSDHPAVRQYNVLTIHKKDNVAEMVIRGQVSKIKEPETWHDGHVRQGVWLSPDGCTVTLSAPLGRINQAMREAKARFDSTKATAARLERQVADQFSSWDGSHKNTARAVKAAMNNPKSFEHVRTTYQTNVQGGHRIISMTYRGTNAYNAVMTNSIKVKASLEGVLVGVIEE